MLKRWNLAAFFAVFALSPLQAAETKHAADADLAICAVCGPREGAGVEEVKAHATLKGQDYAFCNNNCKIEFLKNPAEFLDTGEGKPAPAFSLRGLKKQTVALSAFKGGVVLLDFWATWCKPCVAALPQLQTWHEKYGAQGFSVVGLALDEDSKLVERTTTKLTYTQLLATSKLWQDYKVSVVPALVLIGRDGKVIKRFGSKSEHQDIEAAIKSEMERSSTQSAP